MKLKVKRMLLLIAMLCAMSGASAYDFEVDGVYYNILSLSERSCEVTDGDVEYVGNLTIPEYVTFQGKKMSVKRISTSCNNVKSLKIDSSDERIEVDANCCPVFKNLNDLYLGRTMILVNNEELKHETPFRESDSLKILTIGEKVDTIADYTFGYCRISSVKFEDSDDEIYVGMGLFDSWNNRSRCMFGSAKEAYIGRNFIEKGVSIFYRNSNLKEVTFGGKTTTINESFCSNCTNLEKVNISCPIRKIGGDAFYECNNLVDLVLPNTVKAIGSRAFSYCKKLNSITIPDSVTIIEYNTFVDCKGLIEITIPDAVTEIDDWAFSGCNKLKKINIGRNVKSIFGTAFEGCSSLSVYMHCTTPPQCPRSEYLANISKLYVPENVINDYKNTDTWGKFQIFPLEAVVVDEQDGFRYLVYPEKKEAILISNNCTETEMIIPNKVEYNGNECSVVALSDKCFENCHYLKSVKVPNTISSFGKDCFKDCKILEDVNIPSSVVVLGDGCFSGCLSLKEISIPSTLLSIGDSCFMNCDRLEDINIPTNVVKLGKKSFSGCKKLKKLIIPSGVTLLDDECFFNCENLCSIVLPSAVQTIGISCLENCKSLPSLIIPTTNLLKIWASCFKGCDHLTSLVMYSSDVWFENYDPSWTPNVIGLPEQCTIYVPRDLLDNFQNFCYLNGLNNKVLALEDGIPSTECNLIVNNDLSIINQNGVLTINGIADNERVCLFDIEGHSIANVQAKNGSISLKTKPNSIMVVRIGNRSIKVLCK